jgi:hypothetical protein
MASDLTLADDNKWAAYRSGGAHCNGRHDGNRELIESTYTRISRLTGNAPGSWSYEWMQVASHFEAQGDSASRRGDSIRARSAYLKASLYYALGYFPDNASPEQKASYAKHLSTYVGASRFFDHKMEVVSLPFEHSSIVVHLHVPPGVTKPPIVLWNGGVDWWKAGYHSLIGCSRAASPSPPSTCPARARARRGLRGSTEGSCIGTCSTIWSRAAASISIASAW